MITIPTSAQPPVLLLPKQRTAAPIGNLAASPSPATKEFPIHRTALIDGSSRRSLRSRGLVVAGDGFEVRAICISELEGSTFANCGKQMNTRASPKSWWHRRTRGVKLLAPVEAVSRVWFCCRVYLSSLNDGYRSSYLDLFEDSDRIAFAVIAKG